MNERAGWLLDLYEDGERGLAVWLLTEDDQRVCLHQSFPVRFYAAGPSPRLRQLWAWLRSRPNPPPLARNDRRDLFLPEAIPVLAVEVAHPAALLPLFRQVEAAFPDLTYYDVDVQVQVRHAAVYGSFPLARCRCSIDDQRNVQDLAVLDTPWEIDPEPPPLRVLEVNLLDGDPHHAQPTRLELRCRAWKQAYPIPPGSAPAYWLKTALARFDPDILLTDFGDTWLLEDLLARGNGDPAQLPLNRDSTRPLRAIAEHSAGGVRYMS